MSGIFVGLSPTRPNFEKKNSIFSSFLWWFFVQIAFTVNILLIFVTYLTKLNRYFGLKFEGSSMAERQRFGCLDTWPCIFIQITSLRFPIAICIIQKKWENEMDSFLSKWETIKKLWLFYYSLAEVWLFSLWEYCAIN